MPTQATPHDLIVGNPIAAVLLPRSAQASARLLVHKARHVFGVARSPYEVFSPAGVLFVHIPKNAGKAVSEAVYSHDRAPREVSRLNAHHSAEYLRRLAPLRFERCFKFAVVRDPRSRLISAFNYLKFSSPFEADRRFGTEMLGRFASFDEISFIAQEEFNDLMRWPHFQTQLSFLRGSNGSILVDALIDFNRIESGLSVVARHLGRDWSIKGAPGLKSDRDLRAAERLTSRHYPGDAALYEKVKATPSGVVLLARTSMQKMREVDGATVISPIDI